MAKLLDPKISNLGNIFKLNTTNLIILITIILILLLIYRNTNKIDLFGDTTPIPNYSNSVAQFLDSLRQQQQQLSKYQATMATQNTKIIRLSDQITTLINEST